MEQLSAALARAEDPVLVGIKGLMSEIQPQLRINESKVDKKAASLPIRVSSMDRRGAGSRARAPSPWRRATGKEGVSKTLSPEEVLQQLITWISACMEATNTPKRTHTEITEVYHTWPDFKMILSGSPVKHPMPSKFHLTCKTHEYDKANNPMSSVWCRDYDNALRKMVELQAKLEFITDDFRRMVQRWVNLNGDGLDKDQVNTLKTTGYLAVAAEGWGEIAKSPGIVWFMAAWVNNGGEAQFNYTVRHDAGLYHQNALV